jgi:hypothetical protein
MLDDHKCHVAVGGHGGKENIEGFQAAGGRADAHDGEAFNVAWFFVFFDLFKRGAIGGRGIFLSGGHGHRLSI